MGEFMSLYSLKEIFIYENYKIGIIEENDFLLKRFKTTAGIINNQNIDTRILTCIVKFDESVMMSNDSNEIIGFDYLIFVYDYHKLTEENSINQAIIFHELAHIYYPPDSIEQEIECDIYATKKVTSQAVHNLLNIAIREMKKMGKPTRDLEIRKNIIEALL